MPEASKFSSLPLSLSPSLSCHPQAHLRRAADTLYKKVRSASAQRSLKCCLSEGRKKKKER